VAVSSRDEAEIRVAFMQGSNWDPDSIMEYPFPAGLILQPERYRTEPLRPAGGLSARDLVIRPAATRQYTLQTFGESDTVMVLFERDGGELRYQAGDDRNATLQLKLFQGREYVVRVRLYFGQGSGETAVMLW
jgi:hypothetical protein